MSDTEDNQAPAAPVAFNLNVFKVKYSNEETDDVINWLWSTNGFNNDAAKEGFSWYLMEYKYDNELNEQQPFMTSNLVAGWLRYLDEAHKNSFGSVCILGTPTDQHIKGVWLYQGQDIPKPFVEQELAIPLAENCNFRKLDSDNEADKKIINEFLLWSDPTMDLPHLSGKIFK